MSPLIDQFLDALHAERGVAENTLRGYRADLADLDGFLEIRRHYTHGDVTPQVIEAYFVTLADFKPATAARRRAAIRGFYRWLVREQVRPDDPSERLAMPKVQRPLPGTLSVAQVENLFDVIEADPRMACLVELAYGCGFRVSELVSLAMGAIRNKGWLIVTGKGGVERIAPLNDRARAAIARWLETRGLSRSPWLFPGNKGGHLSARRFSELLKDAARQAGLDPAKVSPHVLRHAFATHLLEGGLDLKVLQTLLGHADIGTTQVYTRVSAKHLKKQIQKHPLAGDGD